MEAQLRQRLGQPPSALEAVIMIGGSDWADAHDIAVDLPEALALQSASQRPDDALGAIRVGVADQVQVAFEEAVGPRRCLAPDLSAEDVLRAEELDGAGRDYKLDVGGGMSARRL